MKQIDVNLHPQLEDMAINSLKNVLTRGNVPLEVKPVTTGQQPKLIKVPLYLSKQHIYLLLCNIQLITHYK